MRSPLSTLDEIWQCQSHKSKLKYLFSNLIQQCEQFSATARLFLACSGGMDSMLLLYLLATLKHQHHIAQPIHVVYIDHQLQAQSSVWGELVQTHCQQLDLFCKIIAVDVQAGNLENQARQARYQALQQQLQPNDVLILAHHQQDQAETVLLRLLQGTGVQGLSAMKIVEQRTLTHLDHATLSLEIPHHYFLWRPLLETAKSDIEALMDTFQIQYADDPMNHSLDYDRVWCRESLFPLLEQRFGKMQDSLTRCAKIMQDSQSILYEVLQQDIAQCVQQIQNDSVVMYIDLNLFRCLSAARQRQLLVWFLQAEQQYKAPMHILNHLQNDVIQAKIDAESQLHYAGHYFLRYDDKLYRYTAEAWQNWQNTPVDYQMSLNLAQVIHSQFGQFKVVLQADDEFGLSLDLFTKELDFMARQGGEKIAFLHRPHRQVLKKYLQQHKVTPWQRKHVQCVQYNATILGVLTPSGFDLAQSDYIVQGGWTLARVSQ
ncbi:MULTISPECIES: tRNA lysidine(34) synthetase TilS [unclassified Acinetobacter]|uniref:tRNA lysidine(34) synthetase TilS n=1 Tax=unclassified Acinetobacter TaxID=196816 RepID=UPI0035B7A2CF